MRNRWIWGFAGGFLLLLLGVAGLGIYAATGPHYRIPFEEWGDAGVRGKWTYADLHEMAYMNKTPDEGEFWATQLISTYWGHNEDGLRGVPDRGVEELLAQAGEPSLIVSGGDFPQLFKPTLLGDLQTPFYPPNFEHDYEKRDRDSMTYRDCMLYQCWEELTNVQHGEHERVAMSSGDSPFPVEALKDVQFYIYLIADFFPDAPYIESTYAVALGFTDGRWTHSLKTDGFFADHLNWEVSQTADQAQ